MPLSDALLRAGLRNEPLSIELGLGLNGIEVSAAEYRRQAADSWQIEGSRAETVVQFGPFANGMIADAIRFYANGTLVDTESFGEQLRILPGALFEYATELRLARAAQ